MELSEIANELVSLKENIVLVYAFNATGKTRLSVAYKDETKRLNEENHSGVYYNAFSEDLFIWNNDEDHHGENISLTIQPSNLNKYHSALSEVDIFKKLEPYNPKFDFRFETYENPEDGIKEISFFIKDNEDTNIKISRGEERIFVWCFFLALFEVEGWADIQSKHFFIDDPVSSLDDHNIFVTAVTLLELIEKYSETRKIVLTTHHIGLFSILADWITKGEKSDKFKKMTKLYILNRKDDTLLLENPNNNVFLYHLRILQVLDKASREDTLFTYHFALLRQILENIASFLGVGQFGYVLQQIGIEDKDKIAGIVNTLSHQKIYYHQTDTMVDDNKKVFRDILDRLKEKYKFVLHEAHQ